MRTIIKHDFSFPGNDTLCGKLTQLTHEFPLSYIFYHPANAKELAHVVIIMEDSGDVETIKSRKWIRNSRDENTIQFHIACQSKMKIQLRSGDPFFAWYCQKSAMIYQNPTTKECYDTNWPSFKKRFKRYFVGYSHDRDNPVSYTHLTLPTKRIV